MLTVYVAFLRGINVGGHNKISMADLKGLFEKLALGRVQTYIQSGNVLFESAEAQEPLRKQIEGEISKTLGMSVAVILRTAQELAGIIANCPFSPEMIAQAKETFAGQSLYVSMFAEIPALAESWQNENEEYRLLGREIYHLFRQGVRGSKLAANLPKLGLPSTMRNWNTLSQLIALARAIG